MDFNLIYTKTPTGEQAMRERTRIVQRNMRMVLTLIDGKATVADLCAKTGNSQLAEQALRQLEKEGFIEPLALEPLMAQSKDLAQEIKAAALEQTSGFSTFGEKNEPPLDQLTRPKRTGLLSDKFPRPTNGTLSVASERASAGMAGSGIDRTADTPSPSAKSPAQNLPAERSGLLNRLKAMLRRREEQADALAVNIATIRRGARRTSSGWQKIVVFSLLALALLLALAGLLFPFSRIVPAVEAALAQASGQPVRIGEISLGVYPKPGLFLLDVRLGNDGEGNAVHVARLRIVPELSSLMDAKKVVRQLEVSGLKLPLEAVAGFAKVFDSLARPSSPIGVRQIHLEKTELNLRGLGLPGMDGEIQLAPDGRFTSIALHSTDHSMRFAAKPLGEGLDISMEGQAWRPAPDSSLIFDSLTVKGRVSGSTLTFDSLNFRVFDGVVRGVARLGLSPQPTLEGEIVFERINAKRFGTALGFGPALEGDASGTMKFSATADSWAAIPAKLQSEGEFSMGRGSAPGFDFAEAARRPSSTPIRGGTTRFENLQTRFKLTTENTRLSGLALSSGLMQSVGQVTVGRDLLLSGLMDVQMHGTVNQMQTSVSISGSLSAPLLQAGKR
jgi:hypothetical protein